MPTPLRYRDKHLCLEEVPLQDIAQTAGTPTYVYSSHHILDSYRQLEKGLREIPHTICYAVKANSNLSILRLLAQEGAGMDIVSGGELFRVGKVGVPGERVMFSGVGKSRDEIVQALDYDGKTPPSFHIESVEELQKINHIAGELGRVAAVSFRFNPNVDPKTHPYISTGLKKNKFGMNAREVIDLVRAKGKYPHVQIKGIGCHIGSQLLSLKPFEDAFAILREMTAKLNRLLPQPLSFIDVGGGLGISYARERTPSIQDYCKLIVRSFGPRSELGYQPHVVLEPGRALVGNAGVLLSEVLYRKPRGRKDFLVIDASMTDLIRPALYEGHHEILPLRKKTGAPQKYDVVGPVCETADFLARDRKLSGTLQSGDRLAILSAGAYGFCMASQYNSRPRAAEVLVNGKEFQVIRQRESYEDLIRGET